MAWRGRERERGREMERDQFALAPATGLHLLDRLRVREQFCSPRHVLLGRARQREGERECVFASERQEASLLNRKLCVSRTLTDPRLGGNLQYLFRPACSLGLVCAVSPDLQMSERLVH